MLQDLMHEAGFAIDSAAAAGSIETGQKSFNQWMSNKATKRNLVISFRKPTQGQRKRSRPAVAIETVARQILCDYLAVHGSATKDRLYDALVSQLVCQGQMRAFDFEALLRSVAEECPAGTEDPDLPHSHGRREVVARPASPTWKLR